MRSRCVKSERSKRHEKIWGEFVRYVRTAVKHEPKFCFTYITDILCTALCSSLSVLRLPTTSSTCAPSSSKLTEASRRHGTWGLSLSFIGKNTWCEKRPLLSNHIICHIQLSRCSNPLLLPFLGVGALTEEDKADILKIVDGHLAEREPRPCDLSKSMGRCHRSQATLRELCVSWPSLPGQCQSFRSLADFAEVSDFEGVIPRGEANKL